MYGLLQSPLYKTVVPGSPIAANKRYHKRIVSPKTPTRQLSVSYTKNDAGHKRLYLLTNSPKILNETMIYLKIQTFTTLI